MKHTELSKKASIFILCFALTVTLLGCQTNPPLPTPGPTEPSLPAIQATKPTDPLPTDPEPTEPQHTEPQPTDPQPTDPLPTDPLPTDPLPTDPQPTDPQPTDPQPTDPQPTDPQPTDPPAEEEELWVPICNEFINLRDKPFGDLICTVPVNATLTVHSWKDIYAYVSYGDIQGYVPSSYIRPASNDYFTRRLKVVKLDDVYSYEQMLADIASLQIYYPDTLHTDIIGYSELGRSIPVLKLGNLDAKYHVLLQGAIHGREHYTACLLMAMADNALMNGIPSDVCYHIIPMVNPDGVVISQTGVLNSTQEAIYWNDVASGHTTATMAEYAKLWKANGLGVDLNGSFPANWKPNSNHTQPSSEGYRGTEPFDAAESRALRDYTLQYSFDTTFSFHASGSVLYYQYGDRKDVNQLSYSLALAVEAVTGYLTTWYDGTTGAGYKDWAIDSLGIPSLTVEIGSYEAPLMEQEIYSTFAKFEGFLSAVDAWLRKNA